MQLLSWTVARLGSRLSLLLEPHHRRIRHSALGRFLDQPLDLAVGLVEPDGTELVLPFTRQGELLYNPEQFERFNSITYRAYSRKHRLRFEFNIHSVFYPQHEQVCLLPAFYLEMRVNPVKHVRWASGDQPSPASVKLFLRLGRENTQITTGRFQDKFSSIELSYMNSLTPRNEGSEGDRRPVDVPDRQVAVREAIVSLNPETAIDPQHHGLSLELPVTEVGSGTKWRLVWGAYTDEDILQFKNEAFDTAGKFRYTRYWKSLEEVLGHAITTRDESLALSRRLEKAVEQSPLRQAQRHLLNQSFQQYLSNTFWCDVAAPAGGLGPDWFSAWQGSCYYQGALDVEYNVAPFHLALWPELLEKQLAQWPLFTRGHGASGGRYLQHDAGEGVRVGGQAFPHDMPVEENCNYLLLLQAYCRVTGLADICQKQAQTVADLARYLMWVDRDGSGFPSEGMANTIDDGSPAVQFARKQTYLAVKRLAALRAAADLLAVSGSKEQATELQKYVESATPRIEREAWLGDHYAVCVDSATTGLIDPYSGQPLPYEQVAGWDAYSIYTGNGLLLPLMTGQSTLLNKQRLISDLLNSCRETLGPYGTGHTSVEPENVWVSQCVWRDYLARYLGIAKPMYAQVYWDLQAMSNTGQMSLGYVDTYISNNLSFHPRGAAMLGVFFAGPRLVIDRLVPGGAHVTVTPDLQYPQRWPLMALADWKAGKIPVCVVSNDGRVAIENEIDPITIHKNTP